MTLPALLLTCLASCVLSRKLEIGVPKHYLKDAENNALPYLKKQFLTELFEFKKFGEPNAFFVQTEPTVRENARLVHTVSLIVTVDGYNSMLSYIYSKHKPTQLLPLYSTAQDDIGVLSTNKSAQHLSYLLGYCSPRLGYFGATIPLFAEFSGPITVNPLSDHDGKCTNIRKALCYGWAKSNRYLAQEFISGVEKKGTLTYNKVVKNLVPLFQTNPDHAKSCAQLGSVLQRVDAVNKLTWLCPSLTPLHSLRNRKWWGRVLTTEPNATIHNVVQDQELIVGYCATVKGDCYANAALYVLGENEKDERYELAEKSDGQLLCYVW